MDKVRVGIIGIGNMGTAHARNILGENIPGMELAALCDSNPEKAALFPDVPFFDDADALIGSGKVDAIIVATPHYGHTTIGIAGLEAGLHVMVEKPISVHKADCERLIAAFKPDSDQVFGAMFNQRTNPHYIKLRELIQSGELGEIRRVVWIITNWFRSYAYYASGGWRATWEGEGGGVLLNQCPHQIDLWQWMFGMPAKVRAFCDIGRYHEIEVEDDVTAYMEYADGKKGVFITTTGEAPGTNRLEVTCERGKVIIEGRDGIRWTRNEIETTEHSKTATSGFGTPASWEVEIPVKGGGPGHTGILKNFTNAILHGEELLAPATEGIHSVELANAMLYSSFTDATVELPLDGAAYETHLKKLIAASTFQKKTAEKTAGGDEFAKSFN